MNITAEAISRLRERGVESSRVNAETMLTSILKCRVADLYTEDIILDTAQLRQLEDMLSRRISGEPLQYITGKVNFYGNELSVEPGIFIPRPETEILVDTVINLITPYAPFILDLCTGSGNIAISLTKTLSNCRIIASDISEKAIGLAIKNAAKNGVSSRINFIRADLLKLPVFYKCSFDAIVSNPPYVAEGMLKDLPLDVKNEPAAALNGGRDGIEFYARIIAESPAFLKDGGLLALELADGAAAKVKEFFEKSIYFNNAGIFNDLNGIERVIAASKI